MEALNPTPTLDALAFCHWKLDVEKNTAVPLEQKTYTDWKQAAAELSALKQRVEALEALVVEAEEMLEQGKEDAEHLDAEYGNVEDYSHIDAWLARARTFIAARKGDYR